MFEYIAIVAGVALIAGAGFLICKKITVSTGHAIVAAIGAALIALPLISNVEWTGDGLKFTTKDQASKFVGQLKDTNEQISTLQSDLVKMSEALKGFSQRIASLEEGKPTAEPSDPSWKTFDPAFFEDLMKRNQDAIATTSERTEFLEQLQKELQYNRAP